MSRSSTFRAPRQRSIAWLGGALAAAALPLATFLGLFYASEPWVVASVPAFLWLAIGVGLAALLTGVALFERAAGGAALAARIALGSAAAVPILAALALALGLELPPASPIAIADDRPFRALVAIHDATVVEMTALFASGALAAGALSGIAVARLRVAPRWRCCGAFGALLTTAPLVGLVLATSTGIAFLSAAMRWSALGIAIAALALVWGREGPSTSDTRARWAAAF